MMKTKTRNWLVTILILAFPFVLFLGFLIFMEEPLPSLPSLPKPNGYDDLVKAGKMLPSTTADYDKMSQEELRKYVSANAGASALARSGMTNECRVPMQFSLAYANSHINQLSDLKRLARAFAAEGRLAELENRPADAAKSYLDLIHLANESGRGGTLMDELVSIAIEALGTEDLQKLVPQLDAKTCREAAAALATLDSQRQTWDEVMQQESDWSHGTFRGWSYEIARWRTRKSTAASMKTTEQKFNAQEKKTRQLIIDLAARAYELDKGHPPSNISDLVPDYLKAAPKDPVTGSNMVYP